MFLADGDTAPADVGLDDSNALPFKLTISCVNFEQRAEFQRTLFNIDQPSRCDTFEWAATGSNGIDHSSRPLPDRPRLLGAFGRRPTPGPSGVLPRGCAWSLGSRARCGASLAQKRLGVGIASGCDAFGLTDACAKHPDDLSPYQLADAKVARKANAQLDLVFDQIHAAVGLTNAISGASETTGSRS